MLGLPDEAGRWVLILLTLGFPVALAVGWVYDIGPEGIERTDQAGSLDPVATPPSRAWALVASGAALGAALFWLISPGTSGTRLGSPDRAVSSDVVAVMPFTVRGSESLGYLGEGIVDLMSAKLSGAGSITTADPRLVISLVSEGGEFASVAGAERDVAYAVGAGRYVTGELLQAGSDVRMTAALHETDDGDAAPRQATVEGSDTEIFDLIDRLAAELLATSLDADGRRLERLAALTTPSLDAAKAYLEGEQFMRRGQYREAAVAYDEALAEDSTFALAHYRKSIAADWVDAYTARTDADRAYRFRDALPERDQALVESLWLRRYGRITDSEQAYRALLHQYPDDVEALIQLGELYFHDNPRRGRSLLESMEPFRRALELEPANPIAQVHLARVYALSDSLHLVEEASELLQRLAPDSERALEVLALHGYLNADASAQARVKEELRRRPWYFTFHTVHGVGRFARDPHGAVDLLEARPSDDALLLSLIPSQLIVSGRYSEAREFLDRRRLEGNATWDMFQAFLLTSGAVPLDRDRMTGLLDALESTTPSELRATSWIEMYEDITDRFLDFQRDFYRALLLVQLGRVDEAGEMVDRLSTAEDFVGLGSVKADAIRALEAELLLARDDRAGALDVLRTMQFEIPHAVSYQPMPDQSRARFLRGELELELGDAETGEAFLLGLDEPWSMWDTYHRPLLYERMGRIAESTGRTREAIIFYSHLVRLWRDCDPELAARREEVQKRLDELMAEGRGSGAD
ncbi:MAG: hypothetical protein OEO79_13190 [Gemmatimonadota bacterium]|nr:hypothetical protein [Gemmatimonadota bacterium]